MSAGIDGVLNTLNPATGEITASENLEAPITTLETARSKANVSVLTTADEALHLLVDGKLASKVALPAEASALAVAADGSFCVVTTPRDRKLIFFKIGEDGLSLDGEPVTLDGTPNAVAISPDGKSIAVSEGSEVALYDVASRSATIQGYWQHTGNVTTIDFSPDGQTIVSGAKDSMMSLWKPADKRFKVTTLAHFQGVIRARFANDNTIFSVGVDNCLRTHKVGAGEGGAAAEEK